MSVRELFGTAFFSRTLWNDSHEQETFYKLTTCGSADKTTQCYPAKRRDGCLLWWILYLKRDDFHSVPKQSETDSCLMSRVIVLQLVCFLKKTWVICGEWNWCRNIELFKTKVNTYTNFLFKENLVLKNLPVSFEVRNVILFFNIPSHFYFLIFIDLSFNFSSSSSCWRPTNWLSRLIQSSVIFG